MANSADASEGKNNPKKLLLSLAFAKFQINLYENYVSFIFLEESTEAPVFFEQE